MTPAGSASAGDQANDKGRRDIREQKPECGLEHIAKSPARRKNGKPYQSQGDVDQLGQRAVFRPQQHTRHADKENLQGKGRPRRGNLQEGSNGSQRSKQRCQQQHPGLCMRCSRCHIVNQSPFQ